MAPDPIDLAVHRRLERQRIPGLALGIRFADGRQQIRCYGHANVEHLVPVSEGTVFQLQSVTKQFVATAMLMLAEEGRVDLEASARSVFPEAPEAWNRFSVRDLLGHSSGLSDFINDDGHDLTIEHSETEFLRMVFDRPPKDPPGTVSAYCNTGYLLAGFLIGRVTGAPYGEYLAKRIFEPLGMESTTVVRLAPILSGRAQGTLWKDGILQNGQYVAETWLSYAGGGLVSSVPDLLRWDEWLDSSEARSLLAPAWTPHRLRDGTATGFGLGWAITRPGGGQAVEHGGSHITGFRTHMTKFLDAGITVVALTNGRGGSEPQRICHDVAGCLDPLLAPPTYVPIPDEAPATTLAIRKAAEAAEGALAKLDGWFGELLDLRLLEVKAAGEAQIRRYEAQMEHLTMHLLAKVEPGDRIVSTWTTPE